ncbi:tail fiber assembly protein [Enterobacter hormaechei]|uniref:tail fiber assembly protein n=1 Tax=Enterobacter hormaechei TaxID=158836 RepID=UPI000627687F|nr:tail fiber assembly protein [Enterobacter hormaechei]KKJ35268.1 tail assembly protein [Enterobacter hormaechei subsp. hoffmannii]
MRNAILEYGFSTTAGNVVVFNYDSETREILSSTTEYIPVGVGLPANACTDAPPAGKDGFVVCRTIADDSWEYLADHRGETVWNTETGEPVEITQPGGYPVGTTTVAPETPYDAWDGEQWVTNEAAKIAADVKNAELKKAELLIMAGAIISPLQDAVELGIADNEESNLYDAWRKYRVLLNRVDPLLVPNLDWPEQPI